MADHRRASVGTPSGGRRQLDASYSITKSARGLVKTPSAVELHDTLIISNHMEETDACSGIAGTGRVCA